jgi:hypothetical protein
MTATNQFLDLWIGASATLSFSLTDANDAPFVLPLGGDIEWRLAETARDVDAACILRKNLSDGIILEDATAEVALSRFDTSGLLPGKFYYHQLVVVDASTDDVAVAAVGSVMVRNALLMPRVATGAAQLGAGGALVVNATLA